jgi:hypothetical protein
MAMTNEEILKLAHNAAVEAKASGEAPPPSAETAYDFLRQLAWEDPGVSDEVAAKNWDAMAMTQQDWVLFRVAYRREVA